ncbi:hypothetical protein ACUY4Q_005001 (plasmid) [Phytobacter sp. AG2a]
MARPGYFMVTVIHGQLPETVPAVPVLQKDDRDNARRVTDQYHMRLLQCVNEQQQRQVSGIGQPEERAGHEPGSL